MDFSLLKPLIKCSHHILISDDGDICIGEIPQKGCIIKSPEGLVLSLLPKLDGEHTIPRIVKELKSLGFNVDKECIIEFINKLNQLGVIEISDTYSDILSQQEINLYDRQLLQFSLIDSQKVGGLKYQEKLKNSRVLILGMGGWGTWCAMQLAMLGIGTLRLVDGDVVELSNLNRQVLYTFDDIGSAKVEAAEIGIKRHNRYTKVEKYNEFATIDRDRLMEVLDGVDVILIAWASLGYFRKNTVEGVIHDIAHEKEIPVIELGGDPLDISVGPIYLNDGYNSGYHAVKNNIRNKFYSQNHEVEKFQLARMKHQFLNGKRKVNAWQSTPSLAVMSGLVTDQIVKLITGYDDVVLKNRKIFFSLRNFKMTEELL